MQQATLRIPDLNFLAFSQCSRLYLQTVVGTVCGNCVAQVSNPDYGLQRWQLKRYPGL
jgi:hypothetical protein